MTSPAGRIVSTTITSSAKRLVRAESRVNGPFTSFFKAAQQERVAEALAIAPNSSDVTLFAHTRVAPRADSTKGIGILAENKATDSGMRLYRRTSTSTPPSENPIIRGIVSGEPKSVQAVNGEAKKSPFQAVTLRKVLIVSGVVLGAAVISGAAIAAYTFYPAATAAHALTLGRITRTAMVNTHQLMILPGITNSLFLASLLFQVVVVPAVQIALPFLMPVFGTVLGLYILYKAANKVGQVAYDKICAITHKMGDELDKTLVGRGFKTIVVTLASVLTESNDPVQKDQATEKTAPAKTRRVVNTGKSTGAVETQEKTSSTYVDVLSAAFIPAVVATAGLYCFSEGGQ